ncbi:MAG: ubiquinol-cytochrome c reductase iron-sulfur subunit [Xanthomonadales bacterium]|nr:ubiquinol-cytochrome c reductase iron-sulfur subunit [Xanthomonadales bacterium]NIX12904.1 ubiquinol-cytochrome c reductase iron-sulfur subunit [Xanthomonadales bacterium]
MSSDGVNKERRRFLIATTSVVGAVGAGFAAVPFIKSWSPSAKAQAVGAPVEVNVGKLEQGQLLKVQWRGQTIGILRRSPQMLEDLEQVTPELRDPDSAESIQPEYAADANRAIRPEFLVVNMHCTHLGCVPQMIPEVGPQPFDENWKGGFYCPCHKSKFDIAGRVYKAVPAPTNLTVPPYSFLDDQTLIIGVNPEGVA